MAFYLDLSQWAALKIAQPGVNVMKAIAATAPEFETNPAGNVKIYRPNDYGSSAFDITDATGTTRRFNPADDGRESAIFEAGAWAPQYTDAYKRYLGGTATAADISTINDPRPLGWKLLEPSWTENAKDHVPGLLKAAVAAVFAIAGGLALGAEFGAVGGTTATTAESSTLNAALSTSANAAPGMSGALGNGITGSMFSTAAPVSGFAAGDLGAGLSAMQITGIGPAAYVGVGSAAASGFSALETLNTVRQYASAANSAAKLMSGGGSAGTTSAARIAASGVPGRAGYSSGLGNYFGAAMPKANSTTAGFLPTDAGTAAGIDLPTIALGFAALVGVLYFVKRH